MSAVVIQAKFHAGYLRGLMDAYAVEWSHVESALAGRDPEVLTLTELRGLVIGIATKPIGQRST